ncbi:MAG: HD domain-containing protein [SAR202 cluster bacterium]|nr:HD domain-containing protein [SAR202 cluster bacterium]
MRQMAHISGDDAPSGAGPIRLAEIVGSLFLATDLGNSQPLETALRCTLLAMGLGREMGLSTPDLACVYWGGLLRFVGCLSTSLEESSFSGDDLELRALLLAADLHDPSDLGPRLEHGLGRQLSPARRDQAVRSFIERGPRLAPAVLKSHCEVGVKLARRLGMSEPVTTVVDAYHERWDDGGLKGLRAEAIPAAARVLDFAQTVVANAHALDAEELRSLLARRSGKQFDPDILPVFTRKAVAGWLDTESVWASAMLAEPGAPRLLPATELVDLARVLGDYSDLKSPFSLGHARGAARLVVEAGRALRMPPLAIEQVEVAALLHDLGDANLPAGMLHKAGPLDQGERERVRGHAYYTERILSASPALAPLGRMGASNHERLDGSGYPHGLTGPSLGIETRLLAVANWYEGALREKPYRPALSRDLAASQLRDGVRRGLFDARVATAVLDIAGDKPSRKTIAYPAGLTDREIEVLRLVGGGMTNKEIAAQLTISPRTVQQHTLHIYEKIDVSTRAAATLFAAEHSLFSPWA